MGGLRGLPVSQQVGLLFVGLFGVLLLASLLVFVRSLRELATLAQARLDRLTRDLRAVWVGALLFWIAWASGTGVSIGLFAVLSFLALRDGDSLVLFPEGTRSNKADPASFKSGLYHLAEQFPEVSLIPTWIDNVQRVMPKGEVVPVPILCTVTFGAPLALQAGEDKRAFLERARDAVLAERPGRA